MLIRLTAEMFRLAKRKKTSAEVFLLRLYFTK
jgi:hypothetical protein